MTHQFEHTHTEHDTLVGVCLVLLHRLATLEKEIMPGPPYHDHPDVVKLRKYLQEKVGFSLNFNELIKEVPGLTEAYYELKIREH